MMSSCSVLSKSTRLRLERLSGLKPVCLNSKRGFGAWSYAGSSYRAFFSLSAWMSSYSVSGWAAGDLEVKSRGFLWFLRLILKVRKSGLKLIIKIN